MLSAMPEAGQELGGTYRLTRLLGEGGMGQVWEAQHVRLPKRFAVKFLHAEALRDKDTFARFQREAEVASSIGNAHIVDVVDFNHDDQGVPYMVLEFLDGEDLAARLQRRGHLPVDQAVAIAEQVAGALEDAHRKGIVHRDLKPQNIFLVRFEERDDFVKVLDFGISKVLDSGSVMTKTGAIFGTPNYMSPEQVDGLIAQIDGRTDVFALGAILYEMLAGRPAFDAPTISAVFNQVCHKDPEPLVTSRSDVPPEMVGAVMRALAKQRDERFASMAEFRAALLGTEARPSAAAALPPTIAAPSAPTTLGAAAGQVASASSEPAPQPAPQPAPPRRRAGALAIAAGAIAVAAVAVFLLRGGGTDAPPVDASLAVAAVTGTQADAGPTGLPTGQAPTPDAKPADEPSEEPGQAGSERSDRRKRHRRKDDQPPPDAAPSRQPDAAPTPTPDAAVARPTSPDAATEPPPTPRVLLKQLETAKKKKAHADVIRIGRQILDVLPRHTRTLFLVGEAACESSDADTARWAHSQVSGRNKKRIEEACAGKGVTLSE